jgi:RNase P protein component
MKSFSCCPKRLKLADYQKLYTFVGVKVYKVVSNSMSRNRSARLNDAEGTGTCHSLSVCV